MNKRQAKKMVSGARVMIHQGERTHTGRVERIDYGDGIGHPGMTDAFNKSNVAYPLFEVRWDDPRHGKPEFITHRLLHLVSIQ